MTPLIDYLHSLPGEMAYLVMLSAFLLVAGALILAGEHLAQQ